MLAWRRLIIALGGLAACCTLMPSQALAQTAYKCKSADGSVIFTDKPCTAGDAIQLGGNYPNYEGKSWERQEEGELDRRTGEIRVFYRCLVNGEPFGYGPPSQMMWCDYHSKSKCRSPEDKRIGKPANNSMNDIAAKLCNAYVERQVQQQLRQQRYQSHYSDPSRYDCSYDDC